MTKQFRKIKHSLPCFAKKRLVFLVFSYECQPHSLILFVWFHAWDDNKPCGKPLGSFGETSGFLTGTHRFPPLEPTFYPIRTTY